MNDEQMEAVKDAVNLVKKGAVKRVDGDTFKAYRVGNVIRVDIEDKE